MVRFVLLAGTFVATHAVLRSGHTHRSGAVEQADAVADKMKRFVKGEIGSSELPDTETLTEIARDMAAVADAVVDVDHTRTQNELDGAKSSVHACNTQWREYESDGLPTRWAQTEAKLAEHNACRKNLHEVCYPSMRNLCNAKEEYKGTVIKAFRDNCAQDTCSKTSGFTDQEKESCNTCLGEAKALHDVHYGQLTKKMEDCTGETNKCDDEDDACDVIQANYESDFCQFVNQVQTRLGFLDTCYSTAKTAYDKQVVTAQTEETANRHVFISAFKINCFSDVIKEISDRSKRGENMATFNVVDKVRHCLESEPTEDQTVTVNGKYTLKDLVVDYTPPDAKLTPTPEYIEDEDGGPAQFYGEDSPISNPGIVGYTSGEFARDLPESITCG